MLRSMGSYKSHEGVIPSNKPLSHYSLAKIRKYPSIKAQQEIPRKKNAPARWRVFIFNALHYIR